jgi:hypothetical protein
MSKLKMRQRESGPKRKKGGEGWMSMGMIGPLGRGVVRRVGEGVMEMRNMISVASVNRLVVVPDLED